ncbi:hypothetical protein FB45DRAFT_1035230 [Roridomyces roridus]|uniref:Uncharacterized protein n=1 Tax=Roridomyces roridus TaxID=1738132 RepID=A0AAD7FCP6_9AGAR|nr:hypothetical protein FB45DRAFT_1035230 [Roridomyces roridus]
MGRNSLGDLKMHGRISQAKVGLRRDLGMVREISKNVEGAPSTYLMLVTEIQRLSDRHSNTSSSNEDVPSPLAQLQQAYKQLASTFHTINSKSRISWEWAELLVQLGGGGAASSPASASTSVPGVGGMDKNKMRERTVTLTDHRPLKPAE